MLNCLNTDEKPTSLDVVDHVSVFHLNMRIVAILIIKVLSKASYLLSFLIVDTYQWRAVRACKSCVG